MWERLQGRSANGQPFAADCLGYWDRPHDSRHSVAIRSQRRPYSHGRGDRGGGPLIAAAGSVRCPDGNAETLATSGSTSITGYVAYRDGSVPTYNQVVGCVRKDRRGFDLTDDQREEVANQPIRLASRWAAVAITGRSGEDFYKALKITRLPLRGERLASYYIAGEDCGNCDRFTDAELEDDGSVAWISQQGTTYTVSACTRRSCLERGNRPRILARGPRVSPHSLRIRDRKVIWKDGGKRRTAALG